MNIEEIKKELKTEKYDFLRNNQYLGKNIILLGLGGSHAYNLATESSDLDVRGVALNTKENILLGTDYCQVTDKETDTTIYSTNKILRLLTENNPSIIELLYLQPEHYLYKSKIGQELLDNKDLFISQKCINTFWGYSDGQARRLSNKSARKQSQSEFEQHILNSITNASYSFKERYFQFDKDSISLYIDKSDREDFDTEIFMDIHLTHYPLRDWTGMWDEMKSIVRSYNKVGKRNENAMKHDKLGKHQSCLIMLLFNAIDLLSTGSMSIYQTGEQRNLLMDIRNGKYLDSNSQATAEFFELLDNLKIKFEYAKKNTVLPEFPDYEKINEFKIYINELIVRDAI